MCKINCLWTHPYERLCKIFNSLIMSHGGWSICFNYFGSFRYTKEVNIIFYITNFLGWIFILMSPHIRFENSYMGPKHFIATHPPTYMHLFSPYIYIYIYLFYFIFFTFEFFQGQNFLLLQIYYLKKNILLQDFCILKKKIIK